MAKTKRKIACLNNIAAEGLEVFPDGYEVCDDKEGADAWLCRSIDLHNEEFPAELRAIGRAGAGVNNIPLKRCSEEGIVVFNAPGANANAVKELVLASLLMSVRPILKGAQWVQSLSGENAEEQVEANKKQFVGNELEGKRLGVIGLGSIGAMVANDAYRLGMEVVGYDPYVSVDTAWSISRRVKRATQIEEVLQTCDFITLHLPLNDKTRGMISTREFSMMKPTAQLLNFSRGEIVDVDAVLEAVTSKKLAGYVTDFTDSRLLHQENIVILPHLGASTQEAEVNCAKMAARTLKRYLETGAIKYSVNFPQVEMAFQSPYRLSIIHRNIPNMLGKISAVIASLDINIDNMLNRGRDEYAYTLVDVNEQDPQVIADVVEKLSAQDDIIRVRSIQYTEVPY